MPYAVDVPESTHDSAAALISVALVVGAILLVLGILAMYVVKVIVPKYPKR